MKDMEKKEFIIDAVIHLFLVACFIFLDQATKARTRSCLLNGTSVELIRNVFSIRLVYNTGGPWGIMGNHTVLLTVISLLILVGIVFAYLWLPKIKRMRPLRICIIMIMSGAIGNMIDRIAYKKVTDMFSFDLIDFPVFNVADVLVVVGCILTFFLTVFYYKDEDFQWKK